MTQIIPRFTAYEHSNQWTIQDGNYSLLTVQLNLSVNTNKMLAMFLPASLLS